VDYFHPNHWKDGHQRWQTIVIHRKQLPSPYLFLLGLPLLILLLVLLLFTLGVLPVDFVSVALIFAYIF
jgi:hypothetical protein